MANNLEYARNVLKQNGYRITNQRDDMYLTLLERTGEHLSPEELCHVLKESGRPVGIATVYRTLQIFESLGLVHKLDFDAHVFRYEIADPASQHHHHHLICVRCDHITEVRLDMLDSLEKNVEDAFQFQITDHTLKFYGICRSCRSAQEETI